MQWKTMFNEQLVKKIATRIGSAYQPFDGSGFLAEATKGLDKLELKERSAHICRAFAKRLPSDFSIATGILIEAMGENDGKGGLEGLDGFLFMPFLDFVGAYGLEHPETALESLEKMTLHFSGEFAIRPFIVQYPDIALSRLKAWAEHRDWRVRRLASEGTRPRLPWAPRLEAFIRDPEPVIGLLDRLHNDPHLVVRRSVANHLNDIAKDHPDRAVAVAKSWWQTGDEGSRWTVRHGLRTLLKQGNAEALTLLGYPGKVEVEIADFELQPQAVRLGERLVFAFSLVSREKATVNLMVDFVLHRTLASGKQAKKVFKLSKQRLSPGQSVQLEGRHHFEQKSTRTYYPGDHAIEILVNGQALMRRDFPLLP